LIKSLLTAVGALLSLWQSKEKRKYIDRRLVLEKEWYEEINRPRPERDNSALDRIERELCQLSDAIVADIGKQDAGPG
jgi:hypothetical protein